MPTTYQPIATSVLNSSQSEVIFSDVSSNYTDLVLVLNTGVTQATACSIRFNEDTGSNYSFIQMWGPTSNTAYSESQASITYIDMQSVGTSVLHTNICNIMSYSQTNKQKAIITRAYDAINNRWYQSLGNWRNTAAINQIKIYVNPGQFIAGSTFSLYGIKAA